VELSILRTDTFSLFRSSSRLHKEHPERRRTLSSARSSCPLALLPELNDASTRGRRWVAKTFRKVPFRRPAEPLTPLSSTGECRQPGVKRVAPLKPIRTSRRFTPSYLHSFFCSTPSAQTCKGSGPNRFGPSVPFRNAHSTRHQSPPTSGMKLIKTHQPDLSRSCHRLICMMIPTMSTGNINRPRVAVTTSGTDSDLERKPTKSSAFRKIKKFQNVDRDILPLVVSSSLMAFV